MKIKTLLAQIVLLVPFLTTFAYADCSANLIDYEFGDGFIDPAQSINFSERMAPDGRTEFLFLFDDSSGVTQECFSISETGLGSAPAIIGFNQTDGGIVLELDRIITKREYTTFTYHHDSGKAQHFDVGFLPGDIDQSNCFTGSDILAYVDCVNLQNCPLQITDVNRSGQTNPNDILTMVDIVNLDGPVGECLPPKPHDGGGGGGGGKPGLAPAFSLESLPSDIDIYNY